MEIPLLNLRAQYRSIKKEIDGALARVLESQAFILSGEVESFEKEIAAYIGTSCAVGCASGTDALVLALRSLGIGKGDAVITTPFTFFATSEAVSIVGARPVFADIDADTYNIDPAKIEELLRHTTYDIRHTIKAVIPVHLYGQCADMDLIMAVAAKYGLEVIEDSAQAVGAIYKGRKAGSFGRVNALSFFPSKNLGAFGDAGMVVTCSSALADCVRRLRVHGSAEQYVHDEVGCNSRLDSLQAAVLRIKLKKLDSWIGKRRGIAEKYDGAFSGIGIKVPKTVEGAFHAYHQYTIAVDDRDNLLKYLNSKGIAARVYYPVPLHLQPCYGELGHKKGDFPVSERCSGRVLSLPIYPELTEAEIDYVIETVKGFFK